MQVALKGCQTHAANGENTLHLHNTSAQEPKSTQCDQQDAATTTTTTTMLITIH